MYKVCIADDEKYVLESVKRRVEQSGLDVEVVGTAENGLEAYELYENKKPDIFFVDIQMPLCTGLDFVEKVRSLDKDSTTQFIIVTGYDDFNFMKRAIRTSVVNYILKPIQKEEFIETLEEVCKNLKQIQKKQQQEYKKSRIYYQDYAEENQEFSGTGFLLWEEELLKNLKEKQKENRLHEIFPHASWNYIRFHETDNLLWLLGKDIYYTEKEIYEIWETMRREITSPSVMVYKISKKEKLDQLAEKMECTMNERFWKENFHIFRCQEESTPGDMEKNIEYFETALENIRDNSWEEELKRQFQEIFEDTALKNRGRLKNFYYSILILTANKYTLHNIDIPESLKEELYPFALERCRNKEEILEKMDMYMAMLWEKIVEESEKDGLVEQAADYLKKHYAENITLPDLAKEFFVAPNYLVKKFKEKKNITAMQYLDNYRMEKAEELLKNTKYSVTEIADRCGYNDANYFTRVFKKKYGISPRRYREQK